MIGEIDIGSTDQMSQGFIFVSWEVDNWWGVLWNLITVECSRTWSSSVSTTPTDTLTTGIPLSQASCAMQFAPSASTEKRKKNAIHISRTTTVGKACGGYTHTIARNVAPLSWRTRAPHRLPALEENQTSFSDDVHPTPLKK